MSDPAPLTRRSLFGLAAGTALAGPFRTGLVLVTPARDTGPALQVAGPADGDLAGLARRLQAPLARRLTKGGALHVRYGGGADGVTAANQFDARAAPDGEQALLFPGSVVLHQLAGEGVVRLDPARMVPVFAAFSRGVLLVRGAPHGPLRLAAGTDLPATLTALLGLDLLGIPAAWVCAGVAPEVAARTGAANAVFVQGPQAASLGAYLLAQGFSARFSTSAAPGEAGALHAPAFLASLPPARLRQDGLVRAWRALAAASELCAGMVLPCLSPATAIGNWRSAVHDGVADEHVTDLVRRQNLRLVTGDESASALAPVRMEAGTQRMLHQWMARRALPRAG